MSSKSDTPDNTPPTTTDCDTHWRNASPEMREAFSAFMVHLGEHSKVRSAEALERFESDARTRVDGVLAVGMP